ncbi:MAG: MarR family transcriptional regulator [[Clostridium] spiroforme]|uniref:MarR family transcriptional regulator n=1 Tax=Thomasclavelia spiroformis TaxID=29348 RepID=A0A943EHT7_9FIRM|nr:MarR family transcriptional regulator [Thomasclavelia spiroformis]MBS5589155.1 MarR family transcriptional regulator [Thomasclavelia spiroformis]
MTVKKVGFLIKQVHILQEQRLNKKFNRFDLTGAQVFTIINLFKAREKGERLTQKDLERILDISNPTLTGILNRLENKGLIIRMPCKHDARKKYIEVTDKAIDLDKEIRRAFEEAEKELLCSLNDEEVMRLYEYLEKILRSNS